jgi:hypothetical protein
MRHNDVYEDDCYILTEDPSIRIPAVDLDDFTKTVSHVIFLLRKEVTKTAIITILLTHKERIRKKGL